MKEEGREMGGGIEEGWGRGRREGWGGGRDRRGGRREGEEGRGGGEERGRGGEEGWRREEEGGKKEEGGGMGGGGRSRGRRRGRGRGRLGHGGWDGSWVICAGKRGGTRTETKPSHLPPLPLTVLLLSSAPASWSHLRSHTLAPPAPGYHSSFSQYLCFQNFLV